MASLQLSDAVGYQIRDQADHLTSLRMNRMWEFAAGFNGISDDDLQNLRNTLHIMADGYLQ
jgi:DNA/RNA-binding domain of Phe-tRNA-synthetase-like protein